MKSAFDQLMTGLDEVEAFLAGAEKGFKVHVPDQIDVPENLATPKNMSESKIDALLHPAKAK